MLIAVIVAGMPLANESQKQYTVGVDDVLSISVSHDDLKTVLQ